MLTLFNARHLKQLKKNRGHFCSSSLRGAASILLSNRECPKPTCIGWVSEKRRGDIENTYIHRNTVIRGNFAHLFVIFHAHVNAKAVIIRVQKNPKKKY